VFGAIGGTMGHRFGSMLMMGVTGGRDITSVSEPIQTLGRIAAIGPTALMIGLAIGGASLSTKSLRNGALGGAIAGLVSGVLFDPLGAILAPLLLAMKSTQPGTDRRNRRPIESGHCRPHRRHGSPLHRHRRAPIKNRLAQAQAWENEGKEWVVDMPQTFIGLSERATSPSSAIPRIAPMHACIVRHGPAYVLMDSGSGTGTCSTANRSNRRDSPPAT